MDFSLLTEILVHILLASGVLWQQKPEVGIWGSPFTKTVTEALWKKAAYSTRSKSLVNCDRFNVCSIWSSMFISKNIHSKLWSDVQRSGYYCSIRYFNCFHRFWFISPHITHFHIYKNPQKYNQKYRYTHTHTHNTVLIFRENTFAIISYMILIDYLSQKFIATVLNNLVNLNAFH